ncbi:MAG: hypothetical protein ACOCW7_01135 [Bacteroidota bacterium]
MKRKKTGRTQKILLAILNQNKQKKWKTNDLVDLVYGNHTRSTYRSTLRVLNQFEKKGIVQRKISTIDFDGKLFCAGREFSGGKTYEVRWYVS